MCVCASGGGEGYYSYTLSKKLNVNIQPITKGSSIIINIFELVHSVLWWCGLMIHVLFLKNKMFLNNSGDRELVYYNIQVLENPLLLNPKINLFIVLSVEG